MPFLKKLASAVGAIFRRSRIDGDLDDELRAFLDASIEQKVRDGMSQGDATRRARLELGSAAAVKDLVHHAGWESVVESVWQDLRFALRMLRRSPGFSAAAIATLGLGIGGTTAVFSVVDALFLRAPAGVVDPSNARRLYVMRDYGNFRSSEGVGSWADFTSMRDALEGVAQVTAYPWPAVVDIGIGTDAAQVRASRVAPEFFSILGVQPVLGRLLVPDDDSAAGPQPVIVISHAFWQSRFGGASDVVGKSLVINGQPIEIVGVAAAGFAGIEIEPVDVWQPAPFTPPRTTNAQVIQIVETGLAMRYVARLSAGVRADAVARRATEALTRSAADRPGIDPTPQVLARSLVSADIPGDRWDVDLTRWLVVVSGFVLIVACANVANLLLARAVTRRRELSVRLSLGAGAWRVMRQHLTEGLMTALLGGVIGLLVAYAALKFTERFPLPPGATDLNLRVWVFAGVVSTVTGLLSSFLPAWRASAIDPMQGLRDSKNATTRFDRSAIRHALLVVQVSLSVSLLVGAGLFVQSLRKVTRIDSGVDVDRLLAVSVDLRRTGIPAAGHRPIYDEWLQRASTLPAVESASYVFPLPLMGGGIGLAWSIPGRPASQDANPSSLFIVGPDYFQTTGTRLLRGRFMNQADERGQPVMMINDTMARLVADDGNAVGRCIALRRQVTDGGCTEIVGVVETQRHQYLDDAARPMMFQMWVHAQSVPVATYAPTLLLRVRGTPAEHVAPVKAALQSARDDFPYMRVRPFAQDIRPMVLPFELGAMLFSAYGVLALILAAVGVHGMLAYFVAERTHEIGVRRALGASEGAMVGLVARQSAVPVTAGLVAGLAAALAGARFLESQLFQVSGRDPVTFIVAALFIVSVALVATLVPARRAMRVDPMTALRES